MPRGPRGKRVVAGGGYSVVSKNSNGVGSVYFEPPSTRADGTVVKERWRATYVDLDGRIKRVSGATRALAESRRDELVRPWPPSLNNDVEFLDHHDRQRAERLVARLGCPSPSPRIIACDVSKVDRVLRRGSRPCAGHRRRSRDAHRVAVEASRSSCPVHRLELSQGVSTDLHRGREDGTDRKQPVRPGQCATRERRQGRSRPERGRRSQARDRCRDRPLGGRRHPVVLPRLARQRSARPRLGGPRPQCRDRTYPTSSDTLSQCGRHVRADEDERSAGASPSRPDRRRSTARSSSAAGR